MSQLQKTVLERSYAGAIEDVWELWTTKEGLESWWGPDGFRVEVKQLDLKKGGKLVYLMIAEGEGQKAFLKQAGMPTTTEATCTYDEVSPTHRLAYINLVDFAPGVKAYNVGTLVELKQVGAEVKQTVTLEPMHDEGWTSNSVAGWKEQLGKLDRVVASRKRS